MRSTWTGILLILFACLASWLPASADTSADRTAASLPSPEGAAKQGASDVLEVAELEDEDWMIPDRYVYRSGWRRDPFLSLLEEEDEEAPEKRTPGVDDLYIVGILWGERAHLALVESRWGNSMILREGDSLRDGRVLTISPSGVTVRQHYYGISRRVVLPVVSGEEVRDER